MRKWPVNSNNIRLYGMPWYTEGRFHRLPLSLETRVSTALWRVAGNTSGARIRFQTDSHVVGITCSYRECTGTDDLCIIAKCGMDIYVDGVYWHSVYPTVIGESEFVFFETADKKMRDITIYLPIYADCTVYSVNLDSDASVLPATSFMLDKPLVFYGTSVTQGGCASRGGLSYQAMLCRALHLDFVNLGFSGCGRFESEVAQAIAELPMAALVIDSGQNCMFHPGEIERRFKPFYTIVRKRNPQLPMLITTPIFCDDERWNPVMQSVLESQRTHIKAVYDEVVPDDPNLYLLEWTKHLYADDCTIDALHPNDMGFYRMKETLLPVMRDMLGLGEDL